MTSVKRIHYIPSCSDHHHAQHWCAQPATYKNSTSSQQQKTSSALLQSSTLQILTRINSPYTAASWFSASSANKYHAMNALLDVYKNGNLHTIIIHPLRFRPERTSESVFYFYSAPQSWTPKSCLQATPFSKNSLAIERNCQQSNINPTMAA